jgi:anti-sigma B factor antagonist
MGFSVKNDPEVVLIRIDDRVLDRSISANFRHYVADALEGMTGRVSIDCSEIDFIDSSGVGALLHVNNLLPEERRPVILSGVSPSVLSVLELVRVHRLFEIVPKA